MKGKSYQKEHNLNDDSLTTPDLMEIKKEPVPRHIAIIMDGNGRWARRKGLPRAEGHRAGVKPIRRTVKAADDLGVKYLTLYAFSTENWGRPQDEIKTLIELLYKTITEELPELCKEEVRLNFIGDLSRFPEFLQNEIKEAALSTQDYSRFTLSLALNYGGRADIINAVRKLLKMAEAGQLNHNDVSESLFSKYLSTAALPEPDLLIRTSGEIRISNFLLWELAYTEFWFTDICWPDFMPGDLYQAVYEFQKRERRYGEL